MPWTPAEFRKKHNKGLTMAEAEIASAMAEKMIASGVPEGEAIATANKHINERRKQKHGDARDMYPKSHMNA